MFISDAYDPIDSLNNLISFIAPEYFSSSYSSVMANINTSNRICFRLYWLYSTCFNSRFLDY